MKEQDESRSKNMTIKQYEILGKRPDERKGRYKQNERMVRKNRVQKKEKEMQEHEYCEKHREKGPAKRGILTQEE